MKSSTPTIKEVQLKSKEIKAEDRAAIYHRGQSYEQSRPGLKDEMTIKEFHAYLIQQETKEPKELKIPQKPQYKPSKLMQGMAGVYMAAKALVLLAFFIFWVVFFFDLLFSI